MTTPQFARATKKSARLRLALLGPAGSGKTFTALTLATHLGGKIAVIDTERGSASKYADLFEFDAMTLGPDFGPMRYVEAIHAAEAAGYNLLIIDSLSHAWMGKGGALELVDDAVVRSRSKNSFGAWREVTPQHNALVDAILQSPCHVIATMRTKTEYVLEKDEKTGKTTPRKIGMAPVQRDGLEYEFDLVGDLDAENVLVVSKTRCPAFRRAVIREPGREMAETLKVWLGGDPGQRAPGNGKKKQDPPKDGLEFEARLLAHEGRLVVAGRCDPGELVEYVRMTAHEEGIDSPFPAWAREAIDIGMKAVEAFDAKVRPR